jgi:hypothetical protein
MDTSPTGEPAAPEHVGLALRAISAGTAGGVAVVAVMMWLVRTLQESGVAPLAPTPADDIATFILLGWTGGALLGGFAAFALMAPLASSYRRGGLAMVAGFATLLVSFVTAPVDSFFGRWGLLGLAAVAAMAMVRLLGRLRRQARGEA